LNGSRRRFTAAAASAWATGALTGCGVPSMLPAPVSDARPGAPASATPDGTAAGAASAVAAGDSAPPAPREFRAAWVATVANIDWPSKPALPMAQQRAEMIAIVERARQIGLNAIVLQVRPAADAIYPSALEPWSEFLTGAMGTPPETGWDPLAAWVQEAHRRGIELHAWFNPYRARHSMSKTPAHRSHVSLARPELVRSYGDQLWLDPAEPAAAAHTLAVVSDVLRRYDIDGVHIDDYFYPYPVPVPGAAPAAPASNGLSAPVPGAAATAPVPDLPFPDDAPWQRYRAGGGALSRDDWRRDHVNRLVQAMHETVHRIKPHVRFGISPFGLGRPDLRPPGIEGFSQYDKLYADVELWVEKGWYDYLAPQLYWAIDRVPQAFPVLLDYWAARVGGSRHLWSGLFTSSIASGTRQWKADEVLQQVALLRQRPAAGGHIHFSMVALMEDRDGIATRLRQGPYAQGALVPATPWLDERRPPVPKVAAGRRWVTMLAAPGDATFQWAVWRRAGGVWRFGTQPAHETQFEIAPRAGEPPVDTVVVSAVSRSGQESPRVTLRLGDDRPSP